MVQPAMASLSETQWPSIPEFYAQRDVFITGATGFMGKCLVEKLLRSLPDIGRLLLLVRPKKGKTEKERIDDMLSSKVGYLRKEDAVTAIENYLDL